MRKVCHNAPSHFQTGAEKPDALESSARPLLVRCKFNAHYLPTRAGPLSGLATVPESDLLSGGGMPRSAPA